MKKLLVTLVVGALLALPMSAMSMDALTESQLGGVDGQAGVSIGFGDDLTTEIDFNKLTWGDPDGVTDNATAGYLVISGDSGIGIDTTINGGSVLSIDIADGQAGYTTNSVAIDDRAFLALSMPSMAIAVDVPTELSVGLSDTAGTLQETMGVLGLSGLAVSVGSADNLYIWAHQ